MHTKDEIYCSVKLRHCSNIREIYDEAMSYAARYDSRSLEKYAFKESDIGRRMVNHIRHNHTNYTEVLKANKVYEAPQDIYHNYKNKFLNRIEDEYPFLEDACDDQKSLVVMAKKRKRNNFFYYKRRKGRRKRGGRDGRV